MVSVIKVQAFWKVFSWSLEHLFLTEGQNNFGNKIPFLNFSGTAHHYITTSHLLHLVSWVLPVLVLVPSMSLYSDFIQILSSFYPYLILILSRFYSHSIQILFRFCPDFILILSFKVFTLSKCYSDFSDTQFIQFFIWIKFI